MFTVIGMAFLRIMAVRRGVYCEGAIGMIGMCTRVCVCVCVYVCVSGLGIIGVLYLANLVCFGMRCGDVGWDGMGWDRRWGRR